MKKLLLIIIVIFTLTFNLETHASSYQSQKITPNTSIKSDLEVLGMNINDYYLTDKYSNYENIYVVAMSEYLHSSNDKIETIFYLYCPLTDNDSKFRISIDEVNYKLNNVEYTYNPLIAKYDESPNGLYKLRGFTYNYIETANIEITSIKWTYVNINNNETITTDIEFEASVKHSLNQVFEVELSFDTTLIIDSYNVVELEVIDEDSFWQNIQDWDFAEYSVLAYFYNFNFPDHIEYDTVEYAKFSYNYNKYEKKIFNGLTADESYEKLLSTEPIIAEYEQGDNELRVGSEVLISSLSTFYLGNRYEDGQFNDSNNLIVGGDSSYFNVDCSVLLDTTLKKETSILGYPFGYDNGSYEVGMLYEYTSLDEIELIELHYRNDDVLYKAQIISEPVDEENFGHITIVDEDNTILDKIFDMLKTIFDWFKNIIEWLVNNPEKLILIIILFFITILFGPVLIPFLILIVKSIFSTLLNLVKSLFKKRKR